MFAENRLIHRRASSSQRSAGQKSVNAARSAAGRSTINYGGGASPQASAASRQSSLAAAGQASVNAARAAAGRPLINYGSKGSVPSSPADLQRYAQEEAQSRVDLQQQGYSPEFINQVSTWWQNVAKLPQDQQDSIMSQMQQQANATVDPAFDTEQGYLQRIRDLKLKNYDEQLSLFKKKEADDYQRIVDETGKNTGKTLQQRFAQLNSANAYDTGSLRRIADEVQQDAEFSLAGDKKSSDDAIAAAQQQRDAASNLLSVSAEQDLNDLSNRRTAARSQRLSDLIGLNASQDLLLQTPTINQMRMPAAARGAPAPAKSSAPAGWPSWLPPPTTAPTSRSTSTVKPTPAPSYYTPTTVLRRGSVSYGYADSRAQSSGNARSRLLGNF